MMHLTESDTAIVLVLAMIFVFLLVHQLISAIGKSKKEIGPTYNCACHHPISTHEQKVEGGYGSCHAEGLVEINHFGHEEIRACACLHYIGEFPPEDYLRMIS